MPNRLAEAETEPIVIDEKPPLRIVALSLSFPGVCRVLEEGEKLGLWNFVRLEGASVGIPPADVYILGAWHPWYEQLLQIISARGKVGILWTSSIGEMDFVSVETGYLNSILDDKRIDFIWFGDKGLAHIFPSKGFYAPYPMVIGNEFISSGHGKTMTLFCPQGPKKNILNQLLAASIVQEKTGFILETNIELPPLIGGRLHRRFHTWLPTAQYRETLSRSSLNFACSWAETNSYQAMEAAAYGVPSVGSATIPWLPRAFMVSNPNNPLEIAVKALEVINQGEVLRKAVADWSIQANQALKTTLENRFNRYKFSQVANSS